MKFNPISKSALKLVDKGSSWVPGALVTRNAGFGTIVAIIDDENILVLWSKQPVFVINDDFRLIDISFSSTILPPVIHQET